MKRFCVNLAAIVTAAVLMQSIAPCASASQIKTSGPVNTFVSGYGTDSVKIGVSTQPQNTSDFVTSCPDIQIVEKLKRIRPSAELANQKRREYISIPLYYQNDYPDILYGDGTVESNGCSITSLAMVATYLTGYDYRPDELAYYFGGRAVNNIERLETGAKTLGLTYEKPKNWHYTLEELKKGKCAIILVDGESKFTGTQHFIVLTGVEVEDKLNSQGEKVGETVKVFVNDPFAPNYDSWDLVVGYEYGFSESDIIQGYQGAWVFDKSTVPEDLPRYFEEEPERTEPRYPQIELSFAERQLLARVVWAEARGECEEGQQAVAEVVLNRMVSTNFADNIVDVIYGENQFRSVFVLDKATPGQAQYEAIERAIYGPYVLPENVVYFARYETNENVWGSIGGHIFCYDEDAPADAAEKEKEDTEDPLALEK